MFRRVEAVQNTSRAVPSPFDCRLVSGVIRTLPYLMRVDSENAAKVAAREDSHSVMPHNVQPKAVERTGPHDYLNKILTLPSRLATRVQPQTAK